MRSHTDFESELRDQLRDLVSAAPRASSLRPASLEEAGPTGPRDRSGHWLSPLVAAAVVGAVAAAGVWIRTVHEAPQESPGAGASTSLYGGPSEISGSVDDFVDRVVSKYSGELQASADWKSRVLVIAVKPPVPADVASLDGATVQGLRIVVAQAALSPSEYDAAIAAIGRSDFANKGRIESFNLPADASAVEVSVRGLDELAAGERTSLEAHLTTVTGFAVRLTKPIPVIRLGP